MKFIGVFLIIVLILTTGVSAINVSYDGFESGNYCGGFGWDDCWETTGSTYAYTYPYDGAYSAFLNSIASISRSSNNSNYSNNNVSFWIYIVSPPVSVSYFTDGQEYILTNLTSADSWSFYEFSVPSSNQINITFKNYGVSSQSYVDDVTFSGDESPICIENWVNYPLNSSCQTNNTKTVTNNYIDLNSCGTNDDLPLDNGSTSEVYCNYCDPNWVQITGEINDCQMNNTRYVQYFDYNYCYQITGLIEDSAPIDDQTWVSCDYLNQEFGCDISEDPFYNGKVEYTCTLPYNGSEFNCLSIVSYDLDDILQVNPQKEEKSDAFFGNNKVESREYFQTNLGLLNAYYTDKNLAADTSFVVTTRCTDGIQTLENQKLVMPELEPLQDIPAWGIWARENFPFIFLLILLIGIASIFLFAWIAELRRAR